MDTCRVNRWLPLPLLLSGAIITGRAQPPPSYGDRAIDSWLERLAEAYGDGQDVYVYFNNDHGGAAVRNARTMVRHADHLHFAPTQRRRAS